MITKEELVRNLSYCPRRAKGRDQRPKPEETPYESPSVQRVFVEKVRNVFVMGEAFSIWRN